MMEVKKNSPAGGEDNKKQAELLKIKINGFLINYFNYFIFSLGIIILAAGLFVLAYPKYRQISQAGEEAKNNLQIEYETKLNYLNSLNNLKKSYQSISGGDKAKIAGMVPAARDASAIITEIESIAVSNSAILNSVKIEPQSAGGGSAPRVESKGSNQPPQGVGLIKIEVNLSSVNYPVLKNIIKTFENNLRLFDITKISFNAGENRAILNIYSYYLAN